ncbi:MAG: aldehyde dehydrogenase family protein [Candidatus Omnitrophica bacterium]|nr:aldehyde dehydrogenase family protein [Candidatus Omnitrophota bacterium]
MSGLIPFRGNYIDGKFTRPNQQGQVSQSPGNLDQPVGVWCSDPKHADRAVCAAQKSFAQWSHVSRKHRVSALKHFARAVSRGREELAVLISREVGKPLWEARQEAAAVVSKIDVTLEHANTALNGYEVAVRKGVNGQCAYRPRGVMVVMGPFNFPAYLATGQIAPALLAGNTVVFKPSEEAPFVGQWLAQAWYSARLPKGVFNLVQGAAEVGRALVAHPGIRGVLFTGSVPTGLVLRHALVDRPEVFLGLEMGGKNPVIVLSDASLSIAAYEACVGAFITAGQRCTSGSRILVERKVVDPFVHRLLKNVDRMQVGDPADPSVFMGPLINAQAVERHRQVCAWAGKEGFKPLREGKNFKAGVRGYYRTPSVHLAQQRLKGAGSAYRDEEHFVPDMAIYAVEDLDEALALANATDYGLAAAVFTRSKRKFEHAFRRLEAGVINWNHSTVKASPKLPFGGRKRSGNDAPAGIAVLGTCVYPVASLSDSRVAKDRESYPGLIR